MCAVYYSLWIHNLLHSNNFAEVLLFLIISTLASIHYYESQAHLEDKFTGIAARLINFKRISLGSSNIIMEMKWMSFWSKFSGTSVHWKAHALQLLQIQESSGCYDVINWYTWKMSMHKYICIKFQAHNFGMHSYHSHKYENLYWHVIIR